VSVVSIVSHDNLASSTIRATNAAVLPQIDSRQTANMKLAFLGVPAEYVNQSSLLSYLPQTFPEFSSDLYMITWKLTFSFVFYPFPQNVSSSLFVHALYSADSAFFNTTLLDNLLSQSQELAIPNCGCLLVFMWIPNATGHQWFYAPECNQDFLLNVTEYDNGIPQTGPSFQNFGGLRRAVYFDISQMMEQLPTESLVTTTLMSLIGNSMRDIFPDMLGSSNPLWVSADVQTYRNYTVSMIRINGTGEQLPKEIVQQQLEDLMPWTNWTITEQTKPADATLDSLVEGRTTELSTPVNITIVLSNGTRFVLEWNRSLNWSPYRSDPLNSYFIDNLHNYFNLTDLDDKSVIPVILLQLDDKTASLSVEGLTMFPDLILIALQGSILTGLDGYGSFICMTTVKHEVGHWVGLPHHQDLAARMICPMHGRGSEAEGEAAFCAFCKDAIARMSFMRYYNKTTSLLMNNHAETPALANELNDSLMLFYHWDYTEAIEKIASIYDAPDATPPTIANVTQAPPGENVRPEDAVNVNATVVDELSGVKGVILNYTNGNGTWITVNMTNIQVDIWNATIPPFPYGTNITYVIVAEDNFNNSITSSEGGIEYQYWVLPEFPMLFALPIFVIVTLVTAVHFGKSFKSHKRAQAAILILSHLPCKVRSISFFSPVTCHLVTGRGTSQSPLKTIQKKIKLYPFLSARA
jgi:hypothetical protein